VREECEGFGEDHHLLGLRKEALHLLLLEAQVLTGRNLGAFFFDFSFLTFSSAGSWCLRDQRA